MVMKIPTLFLDIETLPADEASHDALAYLYERKQEKAREKAGTTEGAPVPATVDSKDLQQFLLGTSFDGAFGRDPLHRLRGWTTNPRTSLRARSATSSGGSESARTVRRFVGHNVMDFISASFTSARSSAGARPSVDLSFARYRCDPTDDTMKEW